MNNKINLYRVHHYSDIRQGPYNFKDLELDIILRKNEPINNERKGYNVLFDEKRNKFGITTYRTRRPGLWEDPLLRKNLFDRGKKVGNLFLNEIKYFAFDSEEQLTNWFHDDKERLVLMKKGFIISKIKEPLNKVILGDKQVLVLN